MYIVSAPARSLRTHPTRFRDRRSPRRFARHRSIAPSIASVWKCVRWERRQRSVRAIGVVDTRGSGVRCFTPSVGAGCRLDAGIVGDSGHRFILAVGRYDAVVGCGHGVSPCGTGGGQRTGAETVWCGEGCCGCGVGGAAGVAANGAAVAHVHPCRAVLPLRRGAESAADVDATGGAATQPRLRQRELRLHPAGQVFGAAGQPAGGGESNQEPGGVRGAGHDGGAGAEPTAPRFLHGQCTARGAAAEPFSVPGTFVPEPIPRPGRGRVAHSPGAAAADGGSVGARRHHSLRPQAGERAAEPQPRLGGEVDRFWFGVQRVRCGVPVCAVAILPLAGGAARTELRPDDRCVVARLHCRRAVRRSAAVSRPRRLQHDLSHCGDDRHAASLDDAAGHPERALLSDGALRPSPLGAPGNAAPPPATAWKRYFRYITLEDIIMHYPMRTGSDKRREMAQRRALVSLIRGMLQWDPRQRWTCFECLQHPFMRGDGMEPGQVWSPPRHSVPRVPPPPPRPAADGGPSG
eukprot:ctg_561.g212